MRVGGWVQASWRFMSIEVYELDAAQVVATGPLGLLLLTPFMRGADIATLERAATVARERTAAPDAGDLVSLLAVFMAPFYGDAAARELVRRVFMSTELLDESPLYRSWRREAREEGRVEGRQEGRQEGWDEGLRRGVQTALEGRFGALDEALVAAINAAPEATLRDLLAHVATDRSSICAGGWEARSRRVASGSRRLQVAPIWRGERAERVGTHPQ
jgi:predicted transposase YdaD